MKRIAIVHDWFISLGGSESVVEVFLDLWPDADLFTVVYDSKGTCNTILGDRQVHTSFIQRLPFSKKSYKAFLPLMPLAIEQLDMTKYDLVISSSHAVAKGIITGPNQLHISYIHSPIRYAWDLQNQYLKQSNLTRGLKALIVKSILHYMRIWDFRTANGVDHMMCNSDFVARRIKKIYGREAAVIYPPVDVNSFVSKSEKADYFLAVSRFVPYKRMDLIAETFSTLPDKKLVMIGDGPGITEIRKRKYENVEILGFQPKEKLIMYMQNAKALIFAAEEDFGIVPVEAQACGTPVIAYGRGGALETVLDSVTGAFFTEQNIESLRNAIFRFENIENQFDADVIRKHSEKFSKERFRTQISKYVESKYIEFVASNSIQ